MPIRALLNSRVERGRAAVRRLTLIFCSIESFCDDADPKDIKVRYVYLMDPRDELPLGWLFSQRSREIISKEVGRPSDCAAGDQTDEFGTPCILARIRSELEGRSAQSTDAALEAVPPDGGVSTGQ